MSSLNPCRRPEIAWRVIDGEAVVVNPRAGLIYPFNPVATRCWELADGTRTAEQIIMALYEEFDVPREQLERDMQAFLATLHEKGLLMTATVMAAAA
jgi:hypothetical protein